MRRELLRLASLEITNERGKSAENVWSSYFRVRPPLSFWVSELVSFWKFIHQTTSKVLWCRGVIERDRRPVSDRFVAHAIRNGRPSVNLGNTSYLGRMSQPWPIRLPRENQRQLTRLKLLSSSSQLALHGCGLSHSNGVVLRFGNFIINVT